MKKQSEVNFLLFFLFLIFMCFFIVSTSLLLTIKKLSKKNKSQSHFNITNVNCISSMNRQYVYQTIDTMVSFSPFNSLKFNYHLNKVSFSSVYSSGKVIKNDWNQTEKKQYNIPLFKNQMIFFRTTKKYDLTFDQNLHDVYQQKCRTMHDNPK